MTKFRFDEAWDAWRSKRDGDTLSAFRIEHDAPISIDSPIPTAGEYGRLRFWLEYRRLRELMNTAIEDHDQAIAEHWARGFHQALRVPWSDK